MRRIRDLVPFFSILLILPLVLPALGLAGASAPVPVQIQLLGATTSPAAAPGDPQQIQFAPGSTSATVHGSVAPNASNDYVLQASAGQTLTVQITTSQGQVVVTITGADGKLLVTDYVGNSTFSGVLPTSQDYTISVQSAGQSMAEYTLGISIPAASSGPTPPAGAMRIQFAAGATSATVQGNLPANGSQQYVIHAAAGQLVQVEVTPQQNVQMSVQGLDGTVLKGSGGVAFFRGDVPTTQDYVITLTGGSTAMAYSLTVTIPVRISFAAGATSATVQGNLPPQGLGHYVVKAQAGQTMTIQTSTTQGQIVVIVYGADGTVLQSDHAGASGFSGTLPSTQDYLIDIRSVGQVAAVFSMTVTIPPAGSGSPPATGAKRILFAPGATSATEQGSLPANGSQQYYVRVRAGQVLIIAVDSQQDVQMSVRGANGTVLKGLGGPAVFRGVVPTSQDYIVTLTAGDETSSYSMTVTVPERISFGPEATSATVQGDLPSNGIGHYVVRAAAGQTMTIKTTATEGQVILVVYGADGTVLQSDHAGASSFSGTLPTTQDYLIEVVAVGQAGADFSMAVTIPSR
jgi:hypothetical protein